MKYAVVGAGFSGAIISRKLAEDGCQVNLFETRSHVAGNCYTERDVDTDIILHKYGPHIFHTNDTEVWDFVHEFGELVPYINRVKTTSSGRVYSLPINLLTINQFFGTTLSPREAIDFIKTKSDDTITDPASLEEQALKFIGVELYEAFFRGYTLKQWGVSPKNLPASILKRLPVRFNYDDNYFSHKFQGIPVNGYTPIIENILQHPKINVLLDTAFERAQAADYRQVFYTGPIDAWFNHQYGRLRYRTLDFYKEVFDGDYQGCAVMNYADESVPYTRITEHKHFAPWKETDSTVIFKEFSKDCGPEDEPYYPLRLIDDKGLLDRYVALANNEPNVSFLGRLGTYRYIDMDVAIREALDASKIVAHCVRKNLPIPNFFVDV